MTWTSLTFDPNGLLGLSVGMVIGYLLGRFETQRCQRRSQRKDC